MNYLPEVQAFLTKYDRLFIDERGIIKLQSANFYKTIDNTDLKVWCICRAIYQLPTVELIEWLKTSFNLDKAIEIGAGNNYLYHHLGIKGIDIRADTSRKASSRTTQSTFNQSTSSSRKD